MMALAPDLINKSVQNPLTVLLVDDDSGIRKSMRSLLASLGVTVIAEADNGRDAIELAVQHRPQVVLMDISMPLMNGLEATRQISIKAPGVRVVIVSAHCDSSVVDCAVQAGAVGFIVKIAVGSEIEEALRAVAANARFFSTLILRRS